MQAVVVVFFGGGLGCVLRYLIGLGFQRSVSNLPVSTFISNLVAAAMFAFVVWYLRVKQLPAEQIRLLLLTGFCGGLSTFSAFSFETYLMMRDGMLTAALVNIALSTSLCILIFYLFRV